VVATSVFLPAKLKAENSIKWFLGFLIGMLREKRRRNRQISLLGPIRYPRIQKDDYMLLHLYLIYSQIWLNFLCMDD
jgi:hypothetical protein